ncbi:MAG: hypothetical protein NTW95_03150 [Candidatus Aminicenantes bacterium]|nr:hypothetical protein [Candidatus Aminicenantes bacterium]
MSSALNIIDLLFIAIFFFSILFGLIRGLVRELLRKSQLAPYLVSVMKTGIQLLPPAWRDKLKSIKLHDYQKDNRDRRTI